MVACGGGAKAPLGGHCNDAGDCATTGANVWCCSNRCQDHDCYNIAHCGRSSPLATNCNAGYVPCTSSNCCPQQYPYFCPSSGRCYQGVDAAYYACGNACLVCGQ
jgi:hypothetical protein